jgi:hypothetical protein
MYVYIYIHIIKFIKYLYLNHGNPGHGNPVFSGAQAMLFKICFKILGNTQAVAAPLQVKLMEGNGLKFKARDHRCSSILSIHA